MSIRNLLVANCARRKGYDHSHVYGNRGVDLRCLSAARRIGNLAEFNNLGVIYHDCTGPVTLVVTTDDVLKEWSA